MLDWGVVAVQAQFFLACLRVVLAGWLHFRLTVDLAVGLTAGFAIGRATLIGKKVAINFLE